VNEVYVDFDFGFGFGVDTKDGDEEVVVIRPGDVVAVIPPVSSG
jgi:hypothetical protein